MSTERIMRNILEGQKVDLDVYATGQGTVYLQWKRGSQSFGAELSLDQADRLCGAIQQARKREQVLLIRKGGLIVGAM